MNRAEQIREHDYPVLFQFFEKHGMPPLAKPSCLVCGRADYEWPPAIQHLELPSVVVCHPCRNGALGREEGVSNDQR